MLGGSTNSRRWAEQARVFRKLARLVKDAGHGMSGFWTVRRFLIENNLVPKGEYPFTRGFWNDQEPAPISPERLAACVLQTRRDMQ